jgi:thioredoxin
MILTCPSCGKKNRSPAERLADTGRCGSCKTPISPVAGPIEADPETFEEVTRGAKVPVLVDFWAAWCGPCRALAPVVDEIAKSYQGKLKVAKMDVDRNTATPQRYGVRGIPTLLVFKGGQVQEQIVGYVPKETIEKALEKLA